MDSGHILPETVAVFAKSGGVDCERIKHCSRSKGPAEPTEGFFSAAAQKHFGVCVTAKCPVLVDILDGSFHTWVLRK